VCALADVRPEPVRSPRRVERGTHLEPCIGYLEMIRAQTPRKNISDVIERAKAVLHQPSTD
jgi:hypothetical protein